MSLVTERRATAKYGYFQYERHAVALRHAACPAHTKSSDSTNLCLLFCILLLFGLFCIFSSILTFALYYHDLCSCHTKFALLVTPSQTVLLTVVPSLLSRINRRAFPLHLNADLDCMPRPRIGKRIRQFRFLVYFVCLQEFSL